MKKQAASGEGGAADAQEKWAELSRGRKLPREFRVWSDALKIQWLDEHWPIEAQ